MCWLSGMMSMGKSAVVCSIAEELTKQSRLAASFFFSHRAGHTHVKYLFQNIAVQLTSSIPALEDFIMAAFRDPFILEHCLCYQFQQLIIKLIQKMNMPLFPSMIIVVDAADECNDEEDLVVELITLIANAQKNSLLLLRVFNGYRNTHGDQVMGSMGTGTVLDFDTLQHTVTRTHGIMG